MKDLERDENGCFLGFRMNARRSKGGLYVATQGGTLQNLRVIWSGMDEPSDELLRSIAEGKRLSLQIWIEKPELALEREMELPDMTVYECIRIVQNAN